MKKRRLSSFGLRKLIHEVISEEKSIVGRSNKKLSDFLFEAEAEALASEKDIKPVTLLVLYGPPAAGKGAAKKAVGDFIGAADQKTNFEDYLKALGTKKGTQFQEEDAYMTKFTGEILPPLVFMEVFERVKAGEDYASIASEYWHQNESAEKFELKDALSPEAFKDLASKGKQEGATEFAGSERTKAWFAQARGFGKKIDGVPDEYNQYLGVQDEAGSTLMLRQAARDRYMNDVISQLQSLAASEEVQDGPFGTVYLADQAGESSANVDRIEKIGALRDEFPAGIRIIGAWIYQPKERTTIANLHRAAADVGGRRVAQTEVDNIFDAGPQIDVGEDGSIEISAGDLSDPKKAGPAITAMKEHFDQVYVYYPAKAVTADYTLPDGRPVGNAICEPLGMNKGYLDIEGCDDNVDVDKSNQTRVRSLTGMEKTAAKKAGIADDKGFIPDPKNLKKTDKEKILNALGTFGFQGISFADVERYLDEHKPDGARGQKGFMKTPWGNAMFVGKGDSGTSPKPKNKVVVKAPTKESVRTESADDLIMERWQKMAGLLK